MQGGQLPLACDQVQCTKSRIDMINTCIPLYSTFFFDGNIVDKSETFFIHYKSESSKTYKLLDSLLLEELNEPVSISNSETYNKIDIIKYFQKSVTKRNIPCMYFFLNHDDVFNVSLSSSNKIYDDIFRTTNGIFIGFSVSFNIFNLSLFTYTFFDILDLFDECFTSLNDGSKKIDTKFVTNKLMNIYNNKETLCKLYDLSLYKKEILTMTNKNNNRETFLNKKFGCVEQSIDESIEINQYKKESLIVEYENHVYDNDNYDDKYKSIIQKLTQTFINIATELYTFSNMLNIPDYKYMFLLTIFSYRLNNKYITGGWCFSIKKTLNQLDSYVNNDDLSESKQEYIKYFIPSTNFPVIYEYVMVTYKNKTYGNCMENVIFQFMKLLFFDTAKANFKLDKFKNMIKQKYYQKLSDIFSNIKNERESNFVKEWVEFIMFEDKNVGYDLIQKDVELNPTINNLFIVLREIFVLQKNYTDDDIDEFFDDLLNIIDASSIISKSNDEDKLILTFSENQTFTIILLHKQHAFFKEAVYTKSNNSLNIINHIGEKNNVQNMYDDVIKNKYYTSSLNQWILLQFVFSDILNITNAQIKYIQYITNKNNNEIKLLFDSLTSDSMDQIREKILIKLVKSTYFFPMIWKYVFNYVYIDVFMEHIGIYDKYLDMWNMTNDNNNTVWHLAVRYIISNTFWEHIMTKEKYLDTWNMANDNNNTVWHLAVQHIKSNTFWEQIVTKEKYLDTWNMANNNTMWHLAVRHIKSNTFWAHIMTKEKYLDTWNMINNNNNNNTVWHLAVQHIKSNTFWEQIVTKEKYLDTWNIINIHKNNVWHFAVKQLKSDIIWEQIMTKEKYLNTWNRINSDKNNVWNLAVQNITSVKFWEYVIIKTDYASNWYKFFNIDYTSTGVWQLLMENIKSDVLWNYVATQDRYLDKWNKYNSIVGFWSPAIKYIKSDKFWEQIMITDKYLDIWDKYVWEMASNNIKSNKFWEHIMTKEKYLDNFGIILYNAYTIWNIILRNGHTKSNIFWEYIGTKEKYLDTWREQEWQYAIKTIQSNKFWEHIAENKKYVEKYQECLNIQKSAHKTPIIGGFYKRKLEKYILKTESLMSRISAPKF